MKQIALPVLVALTLASPCLSQSGPEKARVLLYQLEEALGGSKAIGKVTNLAAKVSCSDTQRRKFTEEIQSILPDKTFIRQTHFKSVVELYRVGDVAWRREEASGAVSVIPEPDKAGLYRQREFHLILLGLINRYEKHTVVGTEIRYGVPCTLMEMEDQWLQYASVCVDTKTYLPITLEFKRPPASGSTHVELTLGDWTRVGDVFFPQTIALRENLETITCKADSIQLGVVKPDLFQIPTEIQKQASEQGGE